MLKVDRIANPYTNRYGAWEWGVFEHGKLLSGGFLTRQDALEEHARLEAEYTGKLSREVQMLSEAIVWGLAAPLEEYEIALDTLAQEHATREWLTHGEALTLNERGADVVYKTGRGWHLI